MEGIREQLVERPRTAADAVKKIMILAAAFLLAVLIIALTRVFLSTHWLALELSILASIGVLWGGWTLSNRLNIEYEYAIVGGELSIDKIFNKRSRKPLCSMTLRKAEGFYKGEKAGDCTVIDAAGFGEKYTIVYSDPNFGKTALIITPDERTLEALAPYLPRVQQ